MNQSIAWLYQQLVGAIPHGPEHCYLCSTSCTQQYRTDKTLADTFNSHYLSVCPTSLYMCAACQWYFDSKAGHPDFRKMSLIVQRDSWLNWERVHMKDDILHALQVGLDVDAYLVVSLSKKKHVLLQAPMNTMQSRNLAIQVEENVAYVTLPIWQEIDTAFMTLLALGHNKGEILSGNLYANTLRKHGQLVQAMRYNQQLAPWRNSAQIELVSYTTILEEKDNDNGTGDGNDTPSGLVAQKRMESDRPRFQTTLQSIHLGASGEQRQSVFDDEQQNERFSQQALW